MAIDFAGFHEMIDAVGGVDVKNPRAFRYTWNVWKFEHNKWDDRFAKGTIHLDGEQALAYARARYTSVPLESSDFARSVRQQRVLGALRSKLGSGGIGSLGPGLSMMDALDGRMKTDLSAIDLFLLSSHLHPDRRIELKEGRILEATANTHRAVHPGRPRTRELDRLPAAAQVPAAADGEAIPRAPRPPRGQPIRRFVTGRRAA